jgi:hypothetical protein
MSEESRSAIDLATFNHAVNPMRPTDVMVPGPVQSAPPVCPTGLCTRHVSKIVYFLYVVTANPKGDVLLACLNCGYEAVYRTETGVFEPRPGREGEPWRAPYRTSREAADQIMRKMNDGKPTGFKFPAEPKAAKGSRKAVVAAPPVEAAAPVVAAGLSPAQAEAPAAVKPLTLKEAATLAGVHVNKLSAAAKKGTLRVHEIGGIQIVMSTDLAEYMGRIG